MSIQNSHQISEVKVMLAKGVDGNGIASIEKTGTEGLVDIYTITYTNGEKTTFTVTNGAGGGMSALLLITSDAGSEVTVTTPSGRVITATQVTGSTTLWQAETTEYGVHTIDAVLSGDDAQATLNVDVCKMYTIDDSHFHASITVTYPTGAIVRCMKDGQTTQYATSSPYTFNVHSTGLWTIDAELSGETFSTDVNITTDGQTESIDLESFPITLTVYSGASDTVYYYPNNDTSESPVTLCTTDSSGEGTGTIPISVFGGSSITLYSSVAKDVATGTNDFSKAFTLTTSSDEVYLMPDGEVLYWYGYKGNYTFTYSDYGTGLSGSTYTENTNNIQLTSTSINSDQQKAVKKTLNVSGITSGSGYTKLYGAYENQSTGDAGGFSNSFTLPVFWNGSTTIEASSGRSATTKTYHSGYGTYSDTNTQVGYSGCAGSSSPYGVQQYGYTWLYGLWLA